MGSHGGIVKSQHGVTCVLRWWSTHGTRNFHNFRSQHCTNAIADHVKAQYIKQTQAFGFCSWCAYAIPPSRALNVVSLAWRAGGSPGAREARLARRRLALVRSAFQNNQLSLASQPRPINIHPQVHLEPFWSATRVKQCRVLPNATRPQQYCKTCECLTYTRP